MESHAFHIASSYHNQQNLYREYNKYAAISLRKRVLSAVAFTKAAIASANVGGTGGGFGVTSLPLEVPAASCP